VFIVYCFLFVFSLYHLVMNKVVHWERSFVMSVPVRVLIQRFSAVLRHDCFVDEVAGHSS